MGQGNTPHRSFNTVVNSNREQRAKRQQKGRITLLSICTVIILILLTLIVFLIASIADVIGSDSNEPADTTEQGDTGNTSVVYVPLAWESSKVSSGVLVIVNDDHEFDPDSVARDLIDVYDNRTKINGSNPYQINTVTAAYLHKDAFPHMEAMMQEYYRLTEGDGSILIKYAYRTYDDQEALGSVVKAGFSDHHTGCCIALHQGNASNPPAIDTTHWIFDNCHKYGFVPRYPVGKENETGVSDYEHCYRYVGLPHAAYMTENDLCLEEYVEFLQTHYANGDRLSVTDTNGDRYEIYYVPASATELTTIQVPENYAYTVSGDNIGGFIVTVHLDSPNA